jgi:hypothetical protein
VPPPSPRPVHWRPWASGRLGRRGKAFQKSGRFFFTKYSKSPASNITASGCCKSLAACRPALGCGLRCSLYASTSQCHGPFTAGFRGGKFSTLHLQQLISMVVIWGFDLVSTARVVDSPASGSFRPVPLAATSAPQRPQRNVSSLIIILTLTRPNR